MATRLDQLVYSPNYYIRYSYLFSSSGAHKRIRSKSNALPIALYTLYSDGTIQTKQHRKKGIHQMAPLREQSL